MVLSRARCLLIVALTALMGCATAPPAESGVPQNSNGEGLSCEKRVKVGGIPEEYQWLKRHYPGAKLDMQVLGDCNGSPTDELHITTADGRALTAYFDISSFF